MLGIKQTGVKHINKYTSIVVLNAIPDSYIDINSAIKYARNSMTLDIILNSIKSKKFDLK